MTDKDRLPDYKGYYGQFGGKFVPETLMAALSELELAYAEVQSDPSFQQQFHQLCQEYIGRPTPLYPAEQLSANPREIGLLENLEVGVNLISSLPFQVNLWKVQNLCYGLLEEVYPDFRGRADQGDEKAREWTDHFTLLFDKLSIHVE